MPTNNETIKKLEKRLHDEFLVPPLLFVQLEALVDKRAKADTAKQIFDELEAMTLKASGTCNIPMCVYGDEAEEQYFKLKKKYNIEE